MANQLSGKLETKILSIVIGVLGGIFVVVAIILQIRQSSQYETELIDKAKRISAQLQDTWDQASNVVVKDNITIDDNTVDLISLIHFLPKTKKDSSTVAIDLMMADNFRIKQTSVNFRNPKNKPDAFEETTLKQFDSDLIQARLNRRTLVPEEESVWQASEVGGQSVYRFMQPIYMKKQCLRCHGDRSEVPAFVRDNYEGGYNYRLGDLRGAISMVVPAEALRKSIMGNLIFVISLGGGAILLTTALILLLMQRIIAKPIAKVMVSARSVAQGDLTEKVNYDSNDQIGELADAFNLMVENVKDTVRNILDLTTRLNQVAIDISNTSAGVLRSADAQSAVVREVMQTITKMTSSIDHVSEDMQGLTINVRETKTAIDELVQTVQESSRGIQDANQIFGQVINEIQTGKVSINQVSTTIDGISQRLEQMVLIIQALEKASREITTVAESINRTAKQTNLLAVNASIESAIAGEAGKAFAIVAEEIRDLATRSASSSQQIQEMILNIRTTTAKAVDSVLEANSSAQESIGVVKNADKTFEKITQLYSRSSSIMNRLSGLIDDQMRSSQQVTMKTTDMNIRTNQVMEETSSQRGSSDRALKTVQRLSETAVGNREASLEITQLTQELVNQAEQLHEAIRRFKITDSNKSGGKSVNML
jgi:methyl-accepting chemotaxis protein